MTPEQAMTPEQQKLLNDLASAGALASVASWSSHFEEALAYIQQIMLNNPGRLEEVAKRPDVKFMLGEAAAAAKAASLEMADDAWQAGVKLAKSQGGANPDTEVLDSLHRDLDKIASDVVQNVLGAVKSSEPAMAWPFVEFKKDLLEREVVKTASRSGMTVEAAAKEGFWASRIKPLLGTKVRLVWRTTSAEPCSACVYLNGRTVAAGRQFPWKASPLKVKPYMGVLRTPPLHPNCLPAGELVSAHGVRGATKRWFEGDLVVIRTSKGNELTATPNHPVLTSAGWVGIGSLQVGGKVVHTDARHGEVLGHDDSDDVPSRVEDVAGSFLESVGVLRSEVPVSSPDFHGDGAGSEVAVVGSDRGLGLSTYTTVSELLTDFDLERAGVAELLLDSQSSGSELVLCATAPSNGGVGSSGDGAPLLGSHALHADTVGLGDPTRSDPVLQENSSDDPTGDGVLLSQSLLGGSELVSLEEVVEVRRFPFAGHVFNLETESGWYIGNGIVTHNCRCILEVKTLPAD